MAKTITLTFNSSPNVLLDENITIKIDTGTSILNFTETFKASRLSSFQVALPNPYNTNTLAQNFANAWFLDNSIQNGSGGKGDIFAESFENTITIFVKDDSWQFLTPTGSSIDNGSITFSIAGVNNVVVNSYNENISNPCALVDVEIGVVGGTGIYDVYANSDLVLTGQSSPITLTLIRGLFYDIQVTDSNSDLIGSTFTEDTNTLNEQDISVSITQPSTTLVQINVNSNNQIIQPFTYSIDGVTYFASNSFSDVANGNYSAYVKDALGCIKTFDFSVAGGLIYYAEYNDVIDVKHRIELIKEGSVITPTLIDAYAVLEYPEEKDTQEAIKPCALTLNLLASDSLSFSDLYSEEERTIRVVYKRNDVILFNGWLSSDGLYESFVDSNWYLELNCIDGFGYLKELSYVENETGLNFAGKQSALEIILNCLKRTNLNQNLRTSVNILYEGLSDVNVLDNIYFNTERFIKDDDNTVMDCEEVLKSILEILNSSIIYFEGYWYIFRANELYNSSNFAYYEYDLEGNFIEQSTKQLSLSIGNFSDGFYPHHINANQKKSLERSLGAYRLNLKWGKVFPYYTNTDLIWTNTTTIQDWTINRPEDVADVNLRGFRITRPTANIFVVLTSDFYTVSSNPRIDFSITFSNTNFVNIPGAPNIGSCALNCKVKYVKGGNTYWLNRDGVWAGDTLIQYAIKAGEENFRLSVTSENLPEEDGDIYIEIYNNGFGNALQDLIINKIVLQTFEGEGSPQGQNYTIEKKNNFTPSTNESIKKVFNGDIEDGTYYGTIYKNDQVTETEFWNRKGVVESKNLLRIMIEDRLRMNFKPRQIFEGDIYGYMPYFSILAINNINGKFLPISYIYDTKNNIISLKSKEILNENFNDIDVIYISSLDYGNVVKPTIKG